MSEVWWKSRVGGALEYRYVLELDKDGSTLMPEHNAGKGVSSHRLSRIYMCS